MRYAFIKQERKKFPISALCRVLRVSPSGYYSWLRRRVSLRARRNRMLALRIRVAHRHSRKTYGRRRIYARLRRDGVSCSRNRVARLMRQEGIFGRRRRSFRSTTDSKHSLPVAANLLERNFTVSAPNQVWVSDITYLACEEGWEYLATVMDLFNREIVGWAMQSSRARSLTLKALKMAIGQRQPAPGLIHHSDRGLQYACEDYQKVLSRHGMLCSMSRKGDPWDNAPKESFIGTLKTELVHDWSRPSREKAHREVFNYIEVFYNRQRLHSSLGYLSPAEFTAQSCLKTT